MNVKTNRIFPSVTLHNSEQYDHKYVENVEDEGKWGTHWL